ncbi:NUDIX hydrolase [Paracoccus zhejiangensis]|uniref:NUDIX hydrolase n=1 Tax=Paracoccus zhejiangensis TaxID=1077935 RepID=A0A2H5F1A6_9RHOB|nr:NUDIX hydrolase [Paracoccus zhejiangensis]AUH65335.1 NUDIX hydrolase [Paracoccus zhejiangensis]
MNMLSRSLRMILGRRPPALQVGAICRKAETGEMLLITSRDTGRWVIPKGWPMEGRSLAHAALQEAWEEAGVRGKVGMTELGRFRYDKRQDKGFAVPVEVALYPVEVLELADDYPEYEERHREWFAPGQAAELVNEAGLKQILQGLARAA